VSERPPSERTFEEDLAISRRAHEVEAALDELSRTCRRLDEEAKSTPQKKK